SQERSEQLRSEIEDLREDLGDTAAALAAKTDVKTRARERAGELKQRARENPAPIAAAAGAFVLTLLVSRVISSRRRGGFGTGAVALGVLALVLGVLALQLRAALVLGHRRPMGLRLACVHVPGGRALRFGRLPLGELRAFVCLASARLGDRCALHGLPRPL